MARAIEGSLDHCIGGGLVAIYTVIGQSPRLLPVIIGAYPLPNAGSLEAASKALKIQRANISEETLVSISDLWRRLGSVRTPD